MYNLFPTSEHFQNLSVPSRGVGETKSFGVQANMTKTLHEKKVGTETYRLQIRLFELIDKFEKNIKFKKNIENKEVEKLFETLR